MNQFCLIPTFSSMLHPAHASPSAPAEKTLGIFCFREKHRFWCGKKLKTTLDQQLGPWSLCPCPFLCLCLCLCPCLYPLCPCLWTATTWWWTIELGGNWRGPWHQMSTSHLSKRMLRIGWRCLCYTSSSWEIHPWSGKFMPPWTVKLRLLHSLQTWFKGTAYPKKQWHSIKTGSIISTIKQLPLLVQPFIGIASPGDQMVLATVIWKPMGRHIQWYWKMSSVYPLLDPCHLS